jgi:hypothetical protein
MKTTRIAGFIGALLVFALAAPTVAELAFSEKVKRAEWLLSKLNGDSKYALHQHCGIFADKYKSFESQEKMVYMPPTSGISDRFLGLGSVFMLSLVTNRKFHMGNMPETIGFNFTFDFPKKDMAVNVYDARKIKVFRYPGRPLSVLMGNDVLVNAKDPESLYLLSEEFSEIVLNRSYEWVYICSNRGITIPAFSLPEYNRRLSQYGLTTSTTFGCALNYLFKPKPEIFVPLLPIMREMAKPERRGLRIAIQIRTNDNVLLGNEHVPLKTFKMFFECARRVEQIAVRDHPPGTQATWFLFSDSASIRAQASALYGEKVVTALNVTIEHSAKEKVCRGERCVSDVGFSTAVAEWWLLGEMDYMVASANSGFGKTAAMRGFLRDRLYFTFRRDMATDCTLSDHNSSDASMGMPGAGMGMTGL